MTRFNLFLAAATLATAVAAPAVAQQSRVPAEAPATAQRVVMLCSNDDATRSAFRREHRTAPVFITADEALQARATGQSWSAPRCMNAREHARLVQTLNAYAAVR